jgi:hypothetical protein
MKRLWNIEMAKLKRYQPLWYFSLFYLIAISLIEFFMVDMETSFNFTPFALYAFPQGWQTVTWTASWFHLFLGLVVVIFTCNEYDHRTARQHIIDGLSKKDFFLGKVLLLIALSLMAVIFIVILGTFCSLYNLGSLDNFFSGWHFLGLFWLQTFGYLSAAFLLAILVKRSGFAMMALMGALLTDLIARSQMDEWMANLTPFGSMDNLVKFDFAERMKTIMQTGAIGPDLETLQVAIVAGLWISLFLFSGYRLILKRDV